jgi:hypothetical protein
MQVVSVFQDEIYCDFEGNEGDVFEFKNEDIKPIPLTPEVLEKCGFEKDISSQFGGYLINICEWEKIRIVHSKIIGWHYPLNGYQKPIVNYLHQLQNLYFALTGEELIYKP